MDVLQKAFTMMTSPLHVFFLLGICALLTHHKYSRFSKLTAKFALIYLVITTQPYFADLILYPLEHKQEYYSKEKNSNNVDYIFTPACYYSTHGDVTEVSRWAECSLQRLVRSAQLSKELNVPIIISGGNFLFDKSVIYADKASELLISLGVSKSLIIPRRSGTSTQEEIGNVAPLVKNKTVILVTSATHIQRCNYLFTVNTQLKSLLFAPVDYQSSGELNPYISFPSLYAAVRVQKALYEYGAWIKQWLLD